MINRSCLRCHIESHKLAYSTEWPAKTHDVLGGVVSQHCIQPGAALHPEQSLVMSQSNQIWRTCPKKKKKASHFDQWIVWHLTSCSFSSCSLATDFLPTFMYCMGSSDFDVVQTALRNLPEYVLLCQGKTKHVLAEERRLLSSGLRRPNKASMWVLFFFSFPLLSRTCRHFAPQGVLSGGLRTNWHQFNDSGLHEGPSHGGHLT